jgi:hypothetical protein
MSASNQDYTISMSKNGYRVPLLEKHPLHSLDDPLVEARDLIKQHEDLTLKKNHILVLGMGFAYHIHELKKVLHSQYKNNYTIAVVEPLDITVLNCQKYELIPSSHLLIFSGLEVSELFEHPSFVDFLLKRPGIIAHPQSFAYFKSYYETMLSFKADNCLKKIIRSVKDKEMKKLLLEYPQDLNFGAFLKDHLPQSPKQANEFLLLAIKEIIYSSGDLQNGKDSHLKSR